MSSCPKYTPPLIWQLYHRALLALDHDSISRITKFHRRDDACRAFFKSSLFVAIQSKEGCLIGRLLRCMALHGRGIDPHAATFNATKAGKPYLVSTSVSIDLPLNIDMPCRQTL